MSETITPIVKVRCSRSVRAKKLSRVLTLPEGCRMPCLVCSGIERAAAELFSAAETVPGVKPRCSAITLSVTFPVGFFLCRVLIRRFSKTKLQFARQSTTRIYAVSKHSFSSQDRFPCQNGSQINESDTNRKFIEINCFS